MVRAHTTKETLRSAPARSEEEKLAARAAASTAWKWKDVHFTHQIHFFTSRKDPFYPPDAFYHTHVR